NRQLVRLGFLVVLGARPDEVAVDVPEELHAKRFGAQRRNFGRRARSRRRWCARDGRRSGRRRRRRGLLFVFAREREDRERYEENREGGFHAANSTAEASGRRGLRLGDFVVLFLLFLVGAAS